MTTADPATAPHSSRPQRYLAGALSAVGAAFFLSGNNTALSVYYDGGGTVPAMMFLRYAGGVIGLGLACWLAGQPLRLTAGRRGGAVLIGTIYAIGILCLLTSFTLIPIALAVLTLYTFPLLTTLIKALLERRMPSLLLLSCLAMALVGLAVALEVFDLNYSPAGILTATLAAAGFAVTFVMSERWYPDIDPMAFAYHISVPGLAIMALFYAGYLVMENAGSAGGLSLGLPLFGSEGSVALVLSVTLYTIAILMMFRAIHLIGSPPSSMIMNLEPIFTLAMVTLFLSTPFTVAHLIGAAIVIGAVLISQFTARTPASDEGQP